MSCVSRGVGRSGRLCIRFMTWNWVVVILCRPRIGLWIGYVVGHHNQINLTVRFCSQSKVRCWVMIRGEIRTKLLRFR